MTNIHTGSNSEFSTPTPEVIDIRRPVKDWGVYKVETGLLAAHPQILDELAARQMEQMQQYTTIMEASVSQAKQVQQKAETVNNVIPLRAPQSDVALELPQEQPSADVADPDREAQMLAARQSVLKAQRAA
ncbi:MAG: hypothetical protein JWM81_275 [Candidatus Saccharibacteria bacterium]|nr:hypothetical protein [Candidatus Saccharibacteria bacterium]